MCKRLGLLCGPRHSNRVTRALYVNQHNSGKNFHSDFWTVVVSFPAGSSRQINSQTEAADCAMQCWTLPLHVDEVTSAAFLLFLPILLFKIVVMFSLTAV